MKTLQKSAIKDLPGKSDKPGMKLIKSQSNSKKHSKRVNMEPLFTFHVNRRKLEEVIQNSIRNIIIEEFRLVANEHEIQPDNCSLFAKDGLPVIMLNNYCSLTAREIEVMDLVLLGFNNRKIGLRLNMTLNTVKNHMKNIRTKLGVKDRATACIAYRKLYNK